MKTLEYLNNQSGNHHFNFDGTIIVLWNSGRSLLSLNHFEQRYDFKSKMFDEGNVEQMTAFIRDNEAFIEQYILIAQAANNLQDSYRNIPVKRLVSVTEDGEVLITKIDLSRGYVSVTADSVIPEKYTDLIAWNKESYIDMFMSEEGLSKRAASAKVAEILRYDGIEGIADISLFSDCFTYNRSDYYFDSSSCGCLHDKVLAAHPELKVLIDLHIKPVTIDAIYEYSKITADNDYHNSVLTAGKNIIKNRNKKVLN